MSARRVAVVTGASRGIGRACAIALARAGYDLALLARSGDAGAAPGAAGLEPVAAAVRSAGREALCVRFELLDVESAGRAAARIDERFGGADLLVNNAVYVGPGSTERLLEAPIEGLERTLRANVVTPTALTQQLLPGLLARGGGVVVNVVSGAAFDVPPGAADRGGWSFAYAAQKAALHRLTVLLQVEHGAQGLRAYSLQPGSVLTDSFRAAFADQLERVTAQWRIAPPEVPAAVVAWLALGEDAAARELAGQVVNAQRVCRDRKLLSDWPEERVG